MWSIESLCSASSVAKDVKLHITELLTLAADNVIENTNAEDGSRLNKPSHTFAVVPARGRISGRVVVQADDRGAVHHGARLEGFPWLSCVSNYVI
jgi:hypothetical protein